MGQGEIIGLKIKELRKKHKMTLKQLSEQVDLSISFLSQAERGQATLGISNLEKLAAIFDVDITCFFSSESKNSENLVVHSYEREFIQISNNYIQYALSHSIKSGNMVPQIFEVFPSGNNKEHDSIVFIHSYEEYIYILEGVLNVYIKGVRYVLQPGDCIHVPYNTEHNWINNTGKIAKLLSITYNAPGKA